MADPRITIRGDASPLERELAKAKVALKGFGASATESFAGFSRAGLGAAAIGAALGAGLRSVLAYADGLGKLSQKTGITTETLSALQLGARLADVDMGALETSLKKLAVSMSEAGQGGKESTLAFQQIGVAVTAVDGTLRATDDVLGDVAEAFARMPDGAQKAALAVQLFGRSGTDLIPLLNEGRAGLQNFREEARRLGVEVGSETAKRAEEFNDNLTRLGNAAKGAGLAVAEQFLPQMAAVSSSLVAATKSGEDFGRFGEGLREVFRAVSTFAVLAAEGFKEFALGLGAVGAILSAAFAGEFKRIPAILLELGAEVVRYRLQTTDTLERLNTETKAAGEKRVAIESETARKVIDIKRAERDQLVAILSSQVAAYKGAEAELESSRKRLEDVQKGNKAFLAELAAGPQKPTEELTTLDISEQLLTAKQAIAKGDMEAAATSTGKVKENLLAMAKAGTAGGLELQYFGKQAAALQEQIAQADFTSIEQRLAEIKARIDDTVGKAIVIGFDVTASKENLDKLLAELAKQAKLPITASVVGGLPKVDLEAASGGLIRGPGSDSSDNLLAWLSPGEYIVKASSVRHYGPAWLAKLNAMQLPKFSAGGMVSAAARNMPSAASAGASTTINLTLPTGGTFPLQADVDVAAALTAAVRREALKVGARR